MAKSTELKEEKEEMVDDIRQIKAERDSLQKELTNTKAELQRVTAAHAQLQVSHTEYVQKFGAMKKPYEYAENECRPVGPHAKCPICGWDHATQTKPGMTGRQPHPV